MEHLDRVSLLLLDNKLNHLTPNLVILFVKSSTVLDFDQEIKHLSKTKILTVLEGDSHCTMQKLKNGVLSGQLCQIISPPIFNENSPHLEGWCKNIKKKMIDFPNIFKNGFFKS